MTEFIYGIEAIIQPFKAVILDAWGVLHNGQKTYPYVLDTLAKLAKADIKTLVLSNAPRLQDSVIQSLENCGIPRKAYDFLHSSGQEGYLTFKEQNSFGEICYHMGEAVHRGIFENIPLKRTEKLSEAHFLLNTGFIQKDLDSYRHDDFLKEALELNLLMICFNPDKHVYVGDDLLLCAGSFAERYEQLGGKVHYFGKPHANVYQRAMQFLDIHNPKEILAFGDSFATDIKGGSNAGIQTVLTLTGIDGLTLKQNNSYNLAKLNDLCQFYGVSPDYIIPELRWDTEQKYSQAL